MDLAVIVLLRNEADIFPAFAQHLAALFDRALFLDHNSTDGTTMLIEQACGARPNWQSWRVDIPGLHQALFATYALRHVFATTQADYVFLLDADEFIDVPDRAALLALLQRPRDARCLPSLAWTNAVPLPLTEAPLPIGAKLLAGPTRSEFTKIVVPRAAYAATGGKLKIFSGNHLADPDDGGVLTYETIGTLLHIPLRSIAQMRRKTIMAALAHLARTDRADFEGYHRFDGLRRIQAGNITADDVIGWAANYGDKDAAQRSASYADLRQAGFTERTLDIAHAPAPVAETPSPPGPWAYVAGLLLAWRAAPSQGMRLYLDGATLRAATEPPAHPDRQTLLAQLQQARAERDAARAETAELRASTAWRLTAPLRAAAHRLKRRR